MNSVKNFKPIPKFKSFKYRGEKYIVQEVEVNNVKFTGCCIHKHGIVGCLINANLSDIQKSNTLHKLIKYKKSRS